MEDFRNLNYYERLGVEEDATQEEIKKAHLEMVKQLHPDQRSGPYAGHFDEMLKGVNEAFDALKTPEGRAKYDNRRRYEREKAEREGSEQAEREAREREAERQRAAAEEQRRAEEERQRFEERRRAAAEEEEYRRARARAEEAADGFNWQEDDGNGYDEPAPDYAPSPAAGGDLVARAGALAERIPLPLDMAGAAMFGAVSWMVFVVLVGAGAAIGLSALCALVAVALWRTQHVGVGLLVAAALAIAPVTSLLSTPLIGILGPLALVWAGLKIAAIAGQYRRV